MPRSPLWAQLVGLVFMGTCLVSLFDVKSLEAVLPRIKIVTEFMRSAIPTSVQVPLIIVFLCAFMVIFLPVAFLKNNNKSCNMKYLSLKLQPLHRTPQMILA